MNGAAAEVEDEDDDDNDDDDSDDDDDEDPEGLVGEVVEELIAGITKENGGK